MANGNGNGNGSSNLPEFIPLADIENTQSISTNLNQLKGKFIDPIEKMRSQVLAGTITNRAQESRAHTYFRMLGMPVIRKDGTFYNPGYNPPVQVNRTPDRPEETGNVDINIIQSQNARESEWRTRRTIFEQASLDASVYALVLGVADGMKKFYIESDEQDFTESARRTVISPMYATRTGDEITNFFETGYHRLRPFSVNPATVVKPGTRHVCQPFIKEKYRVTETHSSSNIALKRPGIELILRYRLKDDSESTALADAITASITKAPIDTNLLDLAGLNQSDLVLVVAALANNDEINASTAKEILASLTSYEILNINGFVKTIKALIKILAEAFRTIDEVTRQISWTPLPDKQGPEFDTRQANFVKRKAGRTELEKRLSDLKSKKTETIPEPGKGLTNQDFAISPFIHNSTQRLYDKPIQNISDLITEEQDRGARALRDIELITGEVSGLGLIDIMAINVGLWSIDEGVLLSLVDDEAFERLYAEEDLRSLAVESRKEEGPLLPAQEALDELHDKVNNVLDFADRLFEHERGQNEGEGGEPARS